MQVFLSCIALFDVCIVWYFLQELVRLVLVVHAAAVVLQTIGDNRRGVGGYRWKSD